MTLILKNARYIDWKTLQFVKTNIKVEEGINNAIHLFDDFRQIEISHKDKIIDCEGNLVTRSFVVGHHHSYSALATGMPVPKNTPTNFLGILENIWWHLDKKLDERSIEASAYATAISCAKTGSTFIIDHHSSPNFIYGSLEIIADVFDKLGLNHLLCYEISDRDGLDKTEKAFAETESYLQKHQGLIGLHASFTVSDPTLKKAANLSQKYDSGIHIHVAEDVCDQTDSLEKYGKRVIERLDDLGFLNSSKTILAHCLHINEKERELIKKSKAFIVQNTESNLNNNVGSFNSHKLGSRIMLGTDGMHSDMIRSAQMAFLGGQSTDDINMMDIYRRFRMTNNYLDINGFNGDSDNNLVVLEYDSPTEINHDNFLAHFIYGFSSSHIKHVISNGKLIVKDKVIQTINEEVVLEFCQQQAKKLWRKL